MDAKPLIQQYLELRSEFLGYLYAITRDSDLAEEVYQNAAIVVIEQSQKPEKIRDSRPWMKEVIRRQALHAIRSRVKAKEQARAISPELLEVVSDMFLKDETETSHVQAETKALRKCLEKLPIDKREMVLMRYEKDSSFDQISSQIQSTPAAVQRGLSRIRKRLHDCIRQRLRTAEANS